MSISVILQPEQIYSSMLSLLHRWITHKTKRVNQQSTWFSQQVLGFVPALDFVCFLLFGKLSEFQKDRGEI